MMSRITLHLRKQARSRQGDSQLETYPLGTLTVTALRTRLNFNRSGPPQESPAESRGVAVTVEETTVVHDDDGRLVDMHDDDDSTLAGLPVPGTTDMDKRAAPGLDWFEIRRPAPVRILTGRSQRSRREKKERDPEEQFIV